MSCRRRKSPAKAQRRKEKPFTSVTHGFTAPRANLRSLLFAITRPNRLRSLPQRRKGAKRKTFYERVVTVLDNSASYLCAFAPLRETFCRLRETFCRLRETSVFIDLLDLVHHPLQTKLLIHGFTAARAHLRSSLFIR